MICILGESASGKSTVQEILCEKHGFKRLVTYTTREPRQGEIDGVDYHFISKSEFRRLKEQGYFCETAEYNGWCYATATKDCTDDKIVVVTPHGLRQLVKFKGLNIVSFYINVGRKERLIKILQRGDDIEEAYRRSLSDVGQYDGIEDEVDFVINNSKYAKTPEEVAKEIFNEWGNKHDENWRSILQE